jgi:hypothetical protein
LFYFSIAMPLATWRQPPPLLLLLLLLLVGAAIPVHAQTPPNTVLLTVTLDPIPWDLLDAAQYISVSTGTTQISVTRAHYPTGNVVLNLGMVPLVRM